MWKVELTDFGDDILHISLELRKNESQRYIFESQYTISSHR